MSDVKVLVVEDCVDSAESLAAILRLRGYETTIAHTAMEALAAIDADPPHCVVLDVGLPSMDGAELAHEIRRRHGDDVVLVALTGHAATEPMVRDAFGCVDHYLMKPLDADELTRVLPDISG